ncbi:hypothetical protein DFH09DRAFT_1133959 [Mycena vulgaris]|nr:hypothetical protein DFH09DRAFT_1133959 [Mycena vulgaris]
MASGTVLNPPDAIPSLNLELAGSISEQEFDEADFKVRRNKPLRKTSRRNSPRAIAVPIELAFLDDDFRKNDRPPWTFWMQWDVNLRDEGFAFTSSRCSTTNSESFSVVPPRWHAFTKRLPDVLVKYARKSNFPQEGILIQRLISEPFRP